MTPPREEPQVFPPPGVGIGFTWAKCPQCAYQFSAPYQEAPRQPWPMSERLARQPATLATAAGATAASMIAQADTLPHPWNHVVTILCLIVAVVAAIKVKT